MQSGAPSGPVAPVDLLNKSAERVELDGAPIGAPRPGGRRCSRRADGGPGHSTERPAPRGSGGTAAAEPAAAVDPGAAVAALDVLVEEELRQLVGDTIGREVRSYFLEKLVPEEEPVGACCDEVVSEFVSEASLQLVREVVRELVAEHLLEQKATRVLLVFLTEELAADIAEVAAEVVDTATEEEIVQELADDVVLDMIPDVAHAFLIEHAENRIDRQLDDVRIFAESKVLRGFPAARRPPLTPRRPLTRSSSNACSGTSPRTPHRYLRRTICCASSTALRPRCCCSSATRSSATATPLSVRPGAGCDGRCSAMPTRRHRRQRSAGGMARTGDAAPGPRHPLRRAFCAHDTGAGQRARGAQILARRWRRVRQRPPRSRSAWRSKRSTLSRRSQSGRWRSPLMSSWTCASGWPTTRKPPPPMSSGRAREG